MEHWVKDHLHIHYNNESERHAEWKVKVFVVVAPRVVLHSGGFQCSELKLWDSNVIYCHIAVLDGQAGPVLGGPGQCGQERRLGWFCGRRAGCIQIAAAVVKVSHPVLTVVEVDPDSVTVYAMDCGQFAVEGDQWCCSILHRLVTCDVRRDLGEVDRHVGSEVRVSWPRLPFKRNVGCTLDDCGPGGDDNCRVSCPRVPDTLVDYGLPGDHGDRCWLVIDGDVDLWFWVATVGHTADRVSALWSVQPSGHGVDTPATVHTSQADIECRHWVGDVQVYRPPLQHYGTAGIRHGITDVFTIIAVCRVIHSQCKIVARLHIMVFN